MVDKDKFNDELINVSGGAVGSGESGGAVEKVVPEANPFAPPPPKGAIFHHDDSPLESERDKWKDPNRNPHNTGVNQDTDYESPGKSDSSMSNWRKIVNHPVTMMVAVLAMIWAYTTNDDIPGILLVIIFFIIAPYWFIHRRRYSGYYDDGIFTDEYTHRGCLPGPWRWF